MNSEMEFEGGAAGEPKKRRLPTAWQSVRLLAWSDFDAIWRSWLCRGFLLASAVVTLLMFKGMQAEQKTAANMLETVFAMYLLVWMHGVIFIAGSAFTREQDCLNDAILSRGLTRGQYLSGKLLARSAAILAMIGGILIPGGLWAIRQDKLVRTETGFVVSNARSVKIEAWDPKKLFASAAGIVAERMVEVGAAVQSGDMLAQLDDRVLFDELEVERRAEETARNEVQNAQRRLEDARRAVAQAEDSLSRAERTLVAKDLLSKAEQADREMELRSRKRDLKDSESRMRVAEDAIRTAERTVENSQARVRESRKRLGYAIVTSPVSGYVTEVNVESAQPVNVGAHLFTVAPLDEFQVRVPIYDFDEFKRLKVGLPALVKAGRTEYDGVIERLGATTQPDRWGRDSNYAVVRFKGKGDLGLLGLNADVRLSLPPRESEQKGARAFLRTLTGSGVDDLSTRSGSVTLGWMWIGMAKVFGCALLLVALTVLFLVLFRSPLIAILAGAGLWHVSNLLFDFAGLPDLSYLEMVRTMDKVLSGIANPTDELINLASLFGVAASMALASVALFIARDPVK